MAHNLKSPSAREKLTPRREPYWHCIRVGLYIGFRRTSEGDGTWIARQLQSGSKKYLLRSLGSVGAVGEFDRAMKDAQAWADGVDSGASHKATTVEAACRAYVTHQKRRVSDANSSDAEGRFERLVYGKPFGVTPLDKLKTAQVHEWLNDQLDDDGDEEELRRSKDSANRNLTTLKAALNLALKNRAVATDAGWKTVTRFPNAGRRRELYLSVEDRAKLIEHCDANLAALVTALMLTACRPGEIAKATVADFDEARGTLRLSGKTGQRTVTLSTTAREFFAAESKDKLPAAPILSDAFGNAWNKDSWKKLFKAAARAAKLPDGVVLYTLRHVAISEMIAGGVDTFLVAKLAGTSTSMIDKHYGHLRHEQTRARLDAVAMM
jgi:integrase